LSITPPGEASKLDTVKEVMAEKVQSDTPSQPKSKDLDNATRPHLQHKIKQQEAREEAPSQQYTRPPPLQREVKQQPPQQQAQIPVNPPQQQKTLPLPTIPHPDKSYYSVNSKSYQKIELIGKGGSSKVYKIISGEGKILALKRVKLKGLDEITIDGLMNEVSLLTKVTDDERIIKLFDWERSIDCLYMVLEYGEIDLANLMKKENSTAFVRLYWEQVRHFPFL
jgi:hypothetical protein